MVKKGYISQQIINKLREAELLFNRGSTIAAAISKQIGVSAHTCYRCAKSIMA